MQTIITITITTTTTLSRLDQRIDRITNINNKVSDNLVLKII